MPDFYMKYLRYIVPLTILLLGPQVPQLLSDIFHFLKKVFFVFYHSETSLKFVETYEYAALKKLSISDS